MNPHHKFLLTLAVLGLLMFVIANPAAFAGTVGGMIVMGLFDMVKTLINGKKDDDKE